MNAVLNQRNLHPGIPSTPNPPTYIISKVLVQKDKAPVEENERIAERESAEAS